VKNLTLAEYEQQTVTPRSIEDLYEVVSYLLEEHEKQLEINRAILAYVQGDLQAPWMASAQRLADLLRTHTKAR
jgi:hypothetical protein